MNCNSAGTTPCTRQTLPGAIGRDHRRDDGEIGGAEREKIVTTHRRSNARLLRKPVSQRRVGQA
jgi:hypothetical protein